MQILIIDDDLDLGDLMAELLIGRGHQVAVAFTAADGLRIARELQPRLVFCDIHLGGRSSGLELAQQLRDSTAPAYVVAMTGVDPDTWGERLLGAGFDRVIHKPMRFELIEGIVSAHAGLDGLHPGPGAPRRGLQGARPRLR